MSRKPLCDDQILDAVYLHWEMYAIPPTVRFIVDHSCISSTSAVFKALRRLEADEKIFLSKGRKAVPIKMKKDIISLVSRYE